MSTFFEEGGEALMHYALGLPCPSNTGFQAIADPTFEGSKRGGSANLDLLANVPAWIYPASAKAELDLLLGLSENLKEEKTRFQRTEMLSVAYSIIHLVPRLAAYRHAKKNGHAIAEDLRLWLEHFWSMCRILSHKIDTYRSYVCWAGERSSGYPHPNWFGHHAAWGIALGVIPADGRDWAESIKEKGFVDQFWELRHPGWDHTNSWIDVALVGFAPEIRETSAKFVSCPLDQVVQLAPKFTYREQVYMMVTENGCMQWWGKPGQRASVNGNTGPIGCIKGEGGKVVTAPPDGGPHWRQKSSSVSTEFLTDHVHVEWPEFDSYSGNVPTPSGKVLLFYLIDPERGWVNLLKGEDIEPVDPPPQHPSVEDREYDEAANLLIHQFKPIFEELNESNTTQEERAFLSSELLQMGGRWKAQKPAENRKEPWWKSLIGRG